TAFAETVALRPGPRELQQPVASAPETRAAEAAHAATPAQPPTAQPLTVQPGASQQPVGMPPTLAPRHTSGALAEHADPELVKLFIEEAREELEKIAKQFPIWDQNPLEQNALSTVRRSFHTLKGSGRMVGARDLAELAWAIENLLNRLLDNTLARTPPIVG